MFTTYSSNLFHNYSQIIEIGKSQNQDLGQDLAQYPDQDLAQDLDPEPDQELDLGNLGYLIVKAISLFTLFILLICFIITSKL